MFLLDRLLIIVLLISICFSQGPTNGYGIGSLQQWSSASAGGNSSLGMIPSYRSHISLSNPTTWSNLKFTFLSIGYNGFESTIKNNSKNGYSNLQSAQLIIPIKQKHALGIELHPYSYQKVDLLDSLNSELIIFGDSVSMAKEYKQAGGIMAFNLSAASLILPKTSIGVTFQLLFGSSRQSNNLNIDEIPYTLSSRLNFSGINALLFAEYKFNEINLYFKSKLSIKPLEALSTKLYPYFDENKNGAAQKGLLDQTPGARKLRQNSLAEYKLESELYSAVLEWDFENFSIKSLTSYQNDEILIRRDNDRADLNFLPPFALLPSEYDPETNKQTTVTQEINLVSSERLFGKLDWVAGMFYLDTEVEISILERLDFGFDGTFDPFTLDVIYAYGGDVGFISDSKPERDSMSLYGQGTWNFNDTWRTVFGLRYTEDDVYSEVTNYYGREGTDILEIEGDKITGRLVIEHDINETTMLFGSFTRGFKPGGSNLTYGTESVVAPIVVLPVFEEEVVEAFEVGLKTDLADGRVRLNAAAFYYDYSDLQYQATDPEVFNGGVGNIPESEIFGAELEFSAFLTDSLILDARMAWLDTEITSDHLALDNVQSEAAGNALLGQGFNLFSDEIQIARADQIQNVNGNELAKTPSFTGNIALNWNTDIDSWGEMRSSLQYTYRGDFKHRIFNNAETDIVPSYDVLDLVVGFHPNGDDSWRVELIGKNLTDENGINARFTDVFGVGATGDELIGPRQLMVRLGIDF